MPFILGLDLPWPKARHGAADIATGKVGPNWLGLLFLNEAMQIERLLISRFDCEEWRPISAAD
jgi:hypothetical protein